MAAKSSKEESKTAPTPSFKVQKETPAWAEELWLKFSACISHVFLVTGNVRDVVDKMNTLTGYLSRLFVVSGGGKHQFDLVIQYDRAMGLY